MSRYRVPVFCVVEIEVPDGSDAILRATENRDEDGNPQAVGSDLGGWQDIMYPLPDADDVLRHWAFNRVANGVSDPSLLDGWADLPAREVTVRIDPWSFDYDPTVTEAEP